MGSVPLVLLTLLIGAMPSLTPQAVGSTPDQVLDQQPPSSSTTIAPVQSGQTTDTVVGQAGVRQARGEIARLNQMTRLNNRIENRVQSRIRNRIDRNYDPRANTTSPFKVATEQTQR